MNTDRRQWRFFTQVHQEAGMAGDRWYWERYDGDERIACEAGFCTLPAALADARRNGFDGDASWGHAPFPLLRRFEDWTRFEVEL